jgi:PAS domain S-box-containing protein
MSTTSPASAQDYLELPGQQVARGSGLRGLLFGGLLVLGALAVGVVMLEYSMRGQEAELLANAEARLQLSADGRAKVLSEWLDGRIARAQPVVDSDLFRLFATEAGQGAASTGQNGALAEQLPYMQAALAEFAGQADLAAAYLLGREGRAYLSSAEAPALPDAVRAAAQALFPKGAPTVQPLRAEQGGLVLDIMVPLNPPQAESAAAAANTVGVLVMSLAADSRLMEALAPSPLSGLGERFALLQATGDRVVLVRPGEAERLQPLAGDWPVRPEALAFAERRFAGGAGTALSAGVAVPGATWIVLAQVPVEAVLAPLRTRRIFGGLIVALVTIGLAAAALAFRWRQGSENNRMLAQQYHELASRLQTQRQLLDSINASIQEHISVKARDGAYIYVNPPFAAAVGLPPQSVVGLKDEALFEPAVARVSAELDGQVLEDGRQVKRGFLLEIAGRLRHLEVAKGPFLDDEGRTIGVVSVARDVTDLVEAQQRRDQAAMNTIRALSNTIEAADPYLSGHSRKLERVAGALARRLGCSDMEVRTLEIAANLSQIGKLSVPPEVLTKAERLSTEELAIMRRHIEHADRILSELDFGLPVREVLMQMHERLDGSGYPAGLQAEDIGLAGRILAVADVFAARTAPRAYRNAIPPETALAFLSANDARYDPEVLETLSRLLSEPEFCQALEQQDGA